MITNLREQFNQSYSKEKHNRILNEFESEYPNQSGFRLSESPIFIDQDFKKKLIEVSDSIVEQIMSDEVLKSTKYIPPKWNVPNYNEPPHFLAVDFGICQNADGELEPQLIELQAFPSLFFYQLELIKKFQKQYPFLQNLDYLLQPKSEEEYWNRLQKVLLNGYAKENVVLMELFPNEQKTRIDFAIAKEKIGIETVCFTKIKKKGNQLFYELNGKEIRIKRIFNRLIVDDFQKYPNLKTDFHITDEVEVEWATHPNWFFTISKVLSPVLKHKYIPPCYFVHEFPDTENLENYVLKPLFSYAGQGVILSPTKEQVEAIKNPENYILQKKVKYASVIKDPNGIMAKAELRLLYNWLPGEEKPQPQISLVRMTKSTMINVDHNKKDEIWTGSSLALFQ